jgi:gamma-glutamyltranspeptidase / glutathione hydrolase
MRLRRGMVVSAHGAASEAGAVVLRKGGNAFDAAVATGLVLGVAEPAFSGIGGGGLAVLLTRSGENVALDYRETAPLAASEKMFENVSKEEEATSNSIGPLAVATPGMISGYAWMLQSFGKMKFKDVASYAARAAKAGVSSPRLSDTIIRSNRLGARTKLEKFRDSKRVLIQGSQGRRGLAKRIPNLANTLSKLGKEGPGSFYKGDIPRSISNFLGGIGGILSENDLRNYSVRTRKPVEGEYAGLTVVSMPPPSAGGTLLIQGLKMVDALRDELSKAGEPRRLWILSRIMRRILDERGIFGDPDFVDIDTKELLSDSKVAKLSAEVRSASGVTRPGRHSDLGSTTHYCVADSSGNLVSATETIECYFGSGVVVPDLGLILNDEMHDFDAIPGKPNSISPGKRLVSSMSPTIVFKDDEPYLMLGGAGSERIITSVFQVIYNLQERGIGLQSALSRPRLHPSLEGLMVEAGGPTNVVSELKKLAGGSQREKLDPYFGGVQAMIIDPKGKGVVGGADPRRMGVAVSE